MDMSGSQNGSWLLSRYRSRFYTLRTCVYPLYSLVMKFLLHEGAYDEHLQAWEKLVLRFSVPW
jgi:hypothetical protein